jgi:hypothetical protein
LICSPPIFIYFDLYKLRFLLYVSATRSTYDFISAKMLSTSFRPLGLLLTMLLTLILPAHAWWRMGCGGTLLEGRLDSIVSPGQVSGHTHVILGGNGFAPSMDYDSTQKSTCTSCSIKGDLSNYWSPKLYFHAQNGSFIEVPVIGRTVYYQYVPRADRERLLR